MNNRQRKKSEKHRRALIHGMLDMVLDINGLGGRMQKKTGNLPTAFFEFSGHVGIVRARLYRNGWDGERDVDLFLDFIHTDNAGELERAVLALEADSPAGGSRWTGVRRPEVDLYPAQMKLRFEVNRN